MTGGHPVSHQILTFWLASYPKSGNTWLRLLLAAAGCDEIDINAAGQGSIASDRLVFDRSTLLESALLKHREVERVRPLVHRMLARKPSPPPNAASRIRTIKCHDAYTVTDAGEPLLGGAEAARGAVVLVRDPRDIVLSMAAHFAISIDLAIEWLEWNDLTLGGRPEAGARQLPQRLLSWSAHVSSWLGQSDIPVHLLRYEDLKRDTAAEFQSVMRFLGEPVTDAAAARAARSCDFALLQAQERLRGFGEVLAEDRRFFRQGRAGAWEEHLTDRQARRIEAAHGAMMMKLNYPL